MKRIIKFRVWDETRQQFCDDDEAAINFGHAPFKRWGIRAEDVNGKELLIEQFTEFKDKKGKEIYEGDILEVRAEGSRWVSVIRTYEELYTWDYQSFDVETDTKIIGNIHENPEMIK